MKLFTEKQLRQAYRNAYLHAYRTKVNEDAFVESQTPIELPTDEEIRKECEWLDNPIERINWREGAKWVIEQITKAKKNDDKKWWEITEDEYDEYLHGIKDRFMITEDLPDEEYWNRYPKFDIQHSDYLLSIGFEFEKRSHKDWEHSMFKGDWGIRCGGNGWYIVRDWDTWKFYKCDGFDGLKDFLQHHKI